MPVTSLGILATEFEIEIPNLAQLDDAIKQLPLYADDAGA